MNRRSKRWLLSIALAATSCQLINTNRLQAANFNSFPLASICQFNDYAADTFGPALLCDKLTSQDMQLLTCMHDSNDQANRASEEFAKWAAECNLAYQETAGVVEPTIAPVPTVAPLLGEAPSPSPSMALAPAADIEDAPKFFAPIERYEEYVPYDLSIVDQEHSSCFTVRPLGSMSAFRPKHIVTPFNDDSIALPTSTLLADHASNEAVDCADQLYQPQTGGCETGGVYEDVLETDAIGTGLVAASSDASTSEKAEHEVTQGDCVEGDWQDEIVVIYQDLRDRGIQLFDSVKDHSVTSVAERWVAGFDLAMQNLGRAFSDFALDTASRFDFVSPESFLPVNSYPLADGSVLVTPSEVAFEPVVDETANQLEACFPVGVNSGSTEFVDASNSQPSDVPASQPSDIASESSSERTVDEYNAIAASQYDLDANADIAATSDDEAISSYGVGIDNEVVEGSTNYDYEQIEPQADALADSPESDYFVEDESSESAATAETATTDAIPAIESCPMAIMQIDPNDSRYSPVPEQAAEEVEDELGIDGINLAREVGYTVVGRVAESMHATGNWLQRNAKWLDKFNREIIANQSGNIR